MARFQYVGVVQDSAGNAMSGIPVTVTIHGGGAATLYAGEVGGAPLASLTSDITGTFTFWADNTASYEVVPLGFPARVVPGSIPGVGGAPSGAAGGGLGGTYPNPTITDIRVVSEKLNVLASPYNVPNNNTDGTTGIAAFMADLATAGKAEGIFPPGSYKSSQPLSLTDGMRLVFAGKPPRFGNGAGPTLLTYTGTGVAVTIANTVGGPRQRAEIVGMLLDGTGLAGSIDGVFADGTHGGATNYELGIKLTDVTVRNFPRYQVLLDGLNIDTDFAGLSAHNQGNVSANALVRSQQTVGGGAVVTAITFGDAYLTQYGAGWCYDGNAIDVRFTNGTVNTNGQVNGCGIRAVLASLHIFGTHVEGVLTGGVAPAGSVGVCRSGANSSLIMPDYCASFADGVQVGNPATPSQPAVDTVIQGMVGGNTVDVRLVAGGSRRGTKILAAGETTGSPLVIADDHRIIDGVWELLALHSTGAIVLPRVAPASAPNNSTYVSTVDGKMYFKDNGGTANVLY